MIELIMITKALLMVIIPVIIIIKLVEYMENR